MPGSVSLTPAQLPDGFWDALKLTIFASSQQYPLITLILLLVFAIFFAWGGVAIYGFVTIKRDKIKHDFAGKKVKSQLAIERFRQKQRELGGAAAKKSLDGPKRGK